MDNKSKNPWTKEELEILKKNYPKMGANTPIPNRTKVSIRQKAHYMNLKCEEIQKADFTYTKKEEEILKKEYPQKGTNIPELLKKYSKQSIRTKAFKMGIEYLNDSKWNDQDIFILQKYYECTGPNIPQLLKRHSKTSIQNKAYELGITISGGERRRKKNIAKYLGMTKQMNCGMEATITKYRSSRDIDVSFADRTIIKHKTLSTFLLGQISNPNVISTGSFFYQNKRYSFPRLKKDFDLTFSSSYMNCLFKKGYSIDEIIKLDKESNHRNNGITDHLGNTFRNIKEMCQYHHVSYGVYQHNRNVKGWDIEKALTYKAFKVEDLFNKKILCKNGLTFNITGYDKNHGRYIGYFIEDPNLEIKTTKTSINENNIKHPQLSFNRKICHNFLNHFTTQYRFNIPDSNNNDRAWYRCNCNKCTWETDKLMTAQMMVEHVKKYHFDNC